MRPLRGGREISARSEDGGRAGAPRLGVATSTSSSARTERRALCEVRRIYASRPGSGAGTTTAATASTPRSMSGTPTPCRRCSSTRRRRPWCARDHRVAGAAVRRVASRGRLGIYGFGASDHLAAQVALRLGATVHVVTARRLAPELGAASARDPFEGPDEDESRFRFSPDRLLRVSPHSATRLISVRHGPPRRSTLRRSPRHACSMLISWCAPKVLCSGRWRRTWGSVARCARVGRRRSRFLLLVVLLNSGGTEREERTPAGPTGL